MVARWRDASKLLLPPAGLVVGWAAGVTAGAPAPTAWTIAGIGGWLAVPFNWAFMVVGFGAGVGSYLAMRDRLIPRLDPAINFAPITDKLDQMIALMRQDALTSEQAQEAAQLAVRQLSPNVSQEQVGAFANAMASVARSPDRDVREAAVLELTGESERAIETLIAAADRDAQSAALRLREAAALAGPTNVSRAIQLYGRATDIDREDFWTWINLARLHRASGSLANARRCAELALQRVDSERMRSVCETELGEIALANRDIAAARAHYEAAMHADNALALENPESMVCKRDLAVSHERLGDLAMVEGEHETAGVHYRNSLELREPLAALDLVDLVLHHDVAASLVKLGNVAYARGDTIDALKRYNTSLQMAERMVSIDPSNPQWQRDLSIIHNKLGDLATKTGKLETAANHLAKDIEVAERLAKADPDNSDWQRDLCVSHVKLGRLAATQNQRSKALHHLREGEKIMVGLVNRFTEHVGFQSDLEAVRRTIASLNEAETG